MSRRAVIIVSISFVVSCLTIPSAWAQQCEFYINACRTISTSGNWCMRPSVPLSSSSGDCLVISAPNVNISCDGDPFGDSCSVAAGSGGAAVHFLSTAKNGSFSTWYGPISGYIGVEDDADGFSGTVACAGSGCPAMKATAYGVYFKNAHQSSWFGAEAGDFNGLEPIQAGNTGVLISGGGGNSVHRDPYSNGGGFPGYTPLPVRAGTYGVQIVNSSSNTIHLLQTNAGSNGQGVYVEGGSQHNVIYFNTITGGQYGVRIKLDSPNNFVLNNSVEASGYDLFQGGTGCNRDLWAQNQPISGSLSFNQPQCETY